MLNELIQTNKLTQIFTIRVSSKLSKRRLLYFNPNFQEICAANVIISSSGIKKPFIDSFHYSDYIYFKDSKVQSVYCNDDKVFRKQFLAELIYKRNLLHSDSSSSCLVPYKYLTLLVPSMYDERWQSSPRCLPTTEILKYLYKADQKRSAIDPEVVFCDFEHKMFRYIVSALNISTSLPSNSYSQKLV